MNYKNIILVVITYLFVLFLITTSCVTHMQLKPISRDQVEERGVRR